MYDLSDIIIQRYAWVVKKKVFFNSDLFFCLFDQSLNNNHPPQKFLISPEIFYLIVSFLGCISFCFELFSF